MLALGDQLARFAAALASGRQADLRIRAKGHRLVATIESVFEAPPLLGLGGDEEIQATTVGELGGSGWTMSG